MVTTPLRSRQETVPASVSLSVITPIYNEEKNIPILVDQLLAVLQTLQKPFEIIAINDGSRDGSLGVLRKQALLHPELKVVDFRRNYGQTAAIMAGIDHANGDVIISIDADLQNDPQDIPNLLAKLDEGFDVVSGWRKDRQDAALRNFVSRIANLVISRISARSTASSRKRFLTACFIWRRRAIRPPASSIRTRPLRSIPWAP